MFEAGLVEDPDSVKGFDVGRRQIVTRRTNKWCQVTAPDTSFPLHFPLAN